MLIRAIQQKDVMAGNIKVKFLIIIIFRLNSNCQQMVGLVILNVHGNHSKMRIQIQLGVRDNLRKK